MAVAFGTVFVAELGDKSQLVCLTLATRRPGLPVWAGATLAFCVLNGLAVTVGAALERLVPRGVLLSVAAALFIIFGLLSLRAGGEDDEDAATENGSRGAMLTTFSLIFVAEFGDKTQLAVAALTATGGALSTWIGATGALALSTLSAVLAGRIVGPRIPPDWMSRLSAVAFLAAGAYTGWLAYHAMNG